MENNLPLRQIIPTREFQRDLRVLSKKYRHIKSDVQPIIAKLQAGELLRTRIAGTGYEIFKVRIKNSDIHKGKSGGYRFIYYLQTTTVVILIAIYSKSEQSDIASDRILEIIGEFNESIENPGETTQEEAGIDRNGD